MKSPSAEGAAPNACSDYARASARTVRDLTGAAVLCMALVLCAACRVVLPAPAEVSAPVAILHDLSGSLPGCRVDAVEEYPGERLYDYMNGAAVTYFERKFRTLATGDVFRGSAQAKIELYEMTAAGDAQQLYAEFASSGDAELSAGQAGCCWQGFEPEGIFHRGRFFVRVIAYAKDPAAGKQLLADVAKGVDALLLRAQ